MRATGKLLWVHNSSTDKFTCQTIYEKCGEEGIRDNGVIASFNGISVQAFGRSYWKFDGIEYAVCCVHLLRELNGISENYPEHKWSASFKKLLTDMLKAVKDAKEKKLSALKRVK